MIGSIPVEALIVVSLLAAASCVLLWLEAGGRVSRTSKWILLGFSVLLGMTLLQAVPLPAAFARAIAPATADIWERALMPLEEAGPAWHTLSISPASTHVELLKGLFYGSLFLAALRVAGLEHGHRFLTRVVIASTSIMAFVALAHVATGAQTVFGLYHPREPGAYIAGHLAPLLNKNHLAAYLGLGACVSFGTLLSRRSVPRALSGGMALVLSATCILQASRGATGALVFGLVLTLALALYTQRRFRSTRAAGVIMAAAALAAGVIVSLSFVGEAFFTRDLTKVGIAKTSLELIRESPLVGFGRGTFESVFPSVRLDPTYVTWTNPEVIVIQWVVEWGVPVAIAGFAILAWPLRPQVLLGAVRPAIGPWVAIVATVLHDLVDFHLEVPGIVAAVILCVAIVVSGSAPSPPPKEPAQKRRPRALAIACALATLVAIAIVLPDRGHSLAQERRLLSAEALDASVPRATFHDDIRAALLRYPAEPFLPLLGAVRAQTRGEPGVVAWVGRALERNPRFGRAHFVLARSFAKRNPSQARLEYRLAYEYDAALRAAVVKESVAIVDGPDAALELVPAGPAGTELLEEMVGALRDRLPATAVLLDREIEARDPNALSPRERAVEAAVSDALTDEPWCVGDSCINAATAIAGDLVRREPDACKAHVFVAQLRLKQRDRRALDDLADQIEHVADRPSCQRRFIEVAIEYGQTARADAALDQLVRGGCGATTECIALYQWAASMEEQRGHYVRAVRMYRRISELAPEREDVLERIGELGDRDGVLTDALDAYRTLSLRHPSDPRWTRRIAQLTSAARTSPARSP